MQQASLLPLKAPAGSVVVGLAIIALVGVTGCPPGGPSGPVPVEDDVPIHIVLTRLRHNATAMDFLLRMGGVDASGQFVDDSGKRQSFQAYGTGLFRKPRSLYLKLQPTLGTLQVGSNDEEFWVWQQFQKDRYFWGRHDKVQDRTELDIPLRPDHLVEVLGFSELPERPDSETGPLFWVQPEQYELIFMKRNAADQPYIAKTIYVDRREPFLVRSIIYFRPDGHSFMVATLSDYGLIEDSVALAPRKIRIDWPGKDNWVEFKFDNIKRFDQPAAEKRFIAPRQTTDDLGEVIRVDEDDSVLPTLTPPPLVGQTTQPDRPSEP